MSPANLKDIPDEKSFYAELSNAKKTLVVVHFWAPWAEQCKQMNEVLEELSKANNDVVFLKLEAEEVAEISMKYEVEAVPTFLFIKNEKVIGKMNGADAPQLTKLVKQHINTVAPMSVGQEKDPKAALEERLKKLINAAPCMLFMKGNPDEPKCGFSRQMIGIMNQHKAVFSSFDILSDPEVRQGLKEFSNWPTYPQLYVNGELVGGLDIIKEMVEDGEFDSILPKEDNKEELLNERIKSIINQSPVVLFMKGEPSNPQCGFSRQIIGILNKYPEVEFTHFDIFKDEDVRQGIKKYSDWPTFPQLYVAGELIGGLDIVKEMEENDELLDALKAN